MLPSSLLQVQGWTCLLASLGTFEHASGQFGVGGSQWRIVVEERIGFFGTAVGWRAVCDGLAHLVKSYQALF